jgi:hypothetical protein
MIINLVEDLDDLETIFEEAIVCGTGMRYRHISCLVPSPICMPFLAAFAVYNRLFCYRQHQSFVPRLCARGLTHEGGSLKINAALLSHSPSSSFPLKTQYKGE